MNNVRVIVLRTAGTNCDGETKYAFERAGATADPVHINQLIRGEVSLMDYHILAIAGGFSYGDDISAGKILASELSNKLGDQMTKFVADGRLAIGICNGFQVLVKTGFLPGAFPGNGDSPRAALTTTLFNNNCGSYQCRWVYLKPSENSPCVFTSGIDEIIYLPVAHAEGKLIFDGEETRKAVWKNNMAVFQYTDPDGRPGPFPVNPNGSVDDIAGLCNATGRVFGLMPHPERHITRTQHPRWTRGEGREPGDGFRIFKNAVAFAKKQL